MSANTSVMMSRLSVSTWILNRTFGQITSSCLRVISVSLIGFLLLDRAP
jgi:hypothetical protein